MFFELLPYSFVNLVSLDTTAYANRGAYHVVTTYFRWQDPELDAKLKRLEPAMMRKFESVSGHGVGVYANFDGTISSLDKRSKLIEIFGIVWRGWQLSVTAKMFDKDIPKQRLTTILMSEEMPILVVNEP